MSEVAGPTPTVGKQPHPDGSRVTITRLMYKLSQVPEPNYVIGALCHIHPTTMSDYARGKRDMSPKHLNALCTLLECEPEEILGLIEVDITG